MTDLQASPSALQGWASKLNGAGEELAAAAQGAPEPPNAGRCTAVVAVGLTQVCEALAAVTDGLAASGQAIADGGVTYRQSDAQGVDDLGNVGGN